MKEKIFYYGKQKQQKIAIYFLLIGIAGIIGVIFFFFIENRIWPVRRVTAIFLAILGLGAWLELSLAPKKSNEPAIIINQNGIIGKTTPPAKSAGLIEWHDIEDIDIYKGEMVIILRDKQKYEQRMNSFMAKEGFKLSGGNIRISMIEANATADEITSTIGNFTNKL